MVSPPAGTGPGDGDAVAEQMNRILLRRQCQTDFLGEGSSESVESPGPDRPSRSPYPAEQPRSRDGARQVGGEPPESWCRSRRRVRRSAAAARPSGPGTAASDAAHPATAGSADHRRGRTRVRRHPPSSASAGDSQAQVRASPLDDTTTLARLSMTGTRDLASPHFPKPERTLYVPRAQCVDSP